MQDSTIEEDTETETPKLAHDSMVTVRLSEPPVLTLDTTKCASYSDSKSSPVVSPRGTINIELPNGSENLTAIETIEGGDAEEIHNSVLVSRRSRATLPRVDTTRSLRDELGQCQDGSSETSEDLEEVNWDELERTEDQQTKDEETDNVGHIILCFSRRFVLSLHG